MAQRREQGKMPPGPFRELCGEVGAEIGGVKRRRRERGGKGAWRLSPICHKDGRHVMIANVEQIGLEKAERQWKGERRQMAKLAWCQQYQDMTMQGNLPLPFDTCCCMCLCVRSTCADTNCSGEFPVQTMAFYFHHVASGWQHNFSYLLSVTEGW